jgi:predicted nucleic acid-binding protein
LTLKSTKHSPLPAVEAGEIHARFQHRRASRVRTLASPQRPALGLDIIRRAHTLVLSRFILDEVERVLLYPRLQARYRITVSEAARFTGSLASVADMVEPVIVRPLVLADPADDPVLYTAADGQADVLCTRNIRHFDAPEVQDFCSEHGIRVMTDLDVLHDLLK